MSDGPEIPDAVDRAFTEREVGREDRSNDNMVGREDLREQRSNEREIEREDRSDAGFSKREQERENRSQQREIEREERGIAKDKAAEQRKTESRFKALRDLAIFTAGLAGFIHEVFYTAADRPFLLILTASMMGLPTAIRLDEFRRTGK